MALWQKKVGAPELNYPLGHIGHLNNGFHKLVDALLHIHSCFFSHMMIRDLPLSAVTVSLHYLPRCLRSSVTCNKTPTTTSSEHFKVSFHVIVTRQRPTVEQCARKYRQHASAGKGADINELQADHFMTSEE